MKRTYWFRVVTVALAAGLSLGSQASAKPKKPSLGVRVSPRMGFSPIDVLAIAELTGGDDTEDFYCLGIEWDWDDGSKSQQDSDCEPFEPGKTKIERRFSSEHYYSRAGNFNIRAALKTQDRIVATNGFRLIVRQGLPQDRGGQSQHQYPVARPQYRHQSKLPGLPGGHLDIACRVPLVKCNF